MYFQFDHGLKDLLLSNKGISTSNNLKGTKKRGASVENYEKLFSFISENSNGKKIIIFYHPTGIPTIDGNLKYGTDDVALNLFEKSAKKFGINFIDLTKQTDILWHTEHKTTHGFCTGTAFSGHMNKNGHKIAAHAIADVILLHQEKLGDEN